MARPQKNNADYFSHDNDMRNDRKLKAVRSRFGIEGYGIYCMLLEVLTEADLLCIGWNMMEIEMIAGDFGIDSERLKEIVAYFNTINLVQIVTNQGKQFLICRQLDRRLKPVFDKRKDSFEKWASKYCPERLEESKNYDFESLRYRNAISATENRQSKVKESKVKESKVNDSVTVQISVAETNLETQADFLPDSEKTNPATPAEVARLFFNSWKKPEYRGEQFNRFSNLLGAELEKFCLYWTEPSKNGKKMRWEMEKTWELERRILSWMSRKKIEGTNGKHQESFHERKEREAEERRRRLIERLEEEEAKKLQQEVKNNDPF